MSRHSAGGLVGVDDDGKGDDADAKWDVNTAVHVDGFRGAFHCLQERRERKYGVRRGKPQSEEGGCCY